MGMNRWWISSSRVVSAPIVTGRGSFASAAVSPPSAERAEVLQLALGGGEQEPAEECQPDARERAHEDDLHQSEPDQHLAEPAPDPGGGPRRRAKSRRRAHSRPGHAPAVEREGRDSFRSAGRG